MERSSLADVRQEHTAALKAAFTSAIGDIQQRQWRVVNGGNGHHVREDLGRWESEGGFVPPDTTPPTPSEFIAEMVRGVDTWMSDGTPNPSFEGEKRTGKDVTSYLVGTYNDITGALSVREYNRAHEVVRAATFEKGPDRRGKDDTLKLYVKDDDGSGLMEYSYTS